MTVKDYAFELLAEHQGNHRAAFVDALTARGCDRRTKQFKHYDQIIEWMISNWPEELE